MADPPAANGHHWVTLKANYSMCERCGYVWNWSKDKPDACPPEDGEW